MHKEIEYYLSHLSPLLQKHGIEITEHKDIAYGVQLRLNKEQQSATLNIYYSDKKGLSQVVGAAKGSSLKNLVEALIRGNRVESTSTAAFHTWKAWIGSDECGKGDYFGAPVVCAFAYDKSLDAEFKRLGIMDSKLLKAAEINRIAMHLYRHHAARISCVALKPTKYNELIASFRKEGKNLNHLLAWLHGTAILELCKKQGTMQGVLVDQFSLHKRVQSYLATKACPLPCIERPGAEADPAVAAASIIARYQFVLAHRELGEFYQIDLPLGASGRVIETAVEFCKQYGFGRLNEVAKLHFVTTAKVKLKLEQAELDLFP